MTFLRDHPKLMLVLILTLGLLGLALLVGARLWERYRYTLFPPALPEFPETGAYDPWSTPPPVDGFDYPLQPAEEYAPYVQGVTGPYNVDTRYGAQNPAMGDRGNCFRDAQGNPVPFRLLYHAGVDLFAVDDSGKTVWGAATNAPVHAVAHGVVVFTYDAGTDGQIVIVEHRLEEGEWPSDLDKVYSVYWHVDHVQVRPGEPVERGQVIAAVYDKGGNSHLHWEMRTFANGSELFPAGTAGARGTCNGRFAAVGYTWDDDPAKAHPDFYGYLDPQAFVRTQATP